MSAIGDKFFRAAPGFAVGVLIGLAWMIAFHYLMTLFFGVVLFGGSIPWYFLLLHPFLSVIPVAVGFSVFRRHHVTSGILVVTIVFMLLGTYESEQRALYGVRQSGSSFSAAARQHFRHIWRRE